MNAPCLDPPAHWFRSQFGEDRILRHMFGSRSDGFFIEVGAFDGVNLSTTYLLEQMGWRGILIEPVPELAERCLRARPRSRVVHAAAGSPGGPAIVRLTHAVGKAFLSYTKEDADHQERCLREGATLVTLDVPHVTLNDVLSETSRGRFACGKPWQPGRGWSVDFVSIDTEGSELEVLSGFDLDRFKPTVLMMEYDRPSGAALEPYLGSRGYTKIHRQVINDFYVRTESLPAHFPGPTTFTWDQWQEAVK